MVCLIGGLKYCRNVRAILIWGLDSTIKIYSRPINLYGVYLAYGIYLSGVTGQGHPPKAN